MKRRDVLRSLAGTGAALSFQACAHTPVEAGSLTDADVERMAVALTGVALKRDQVAAVRDMLGRLRFRGKIDPTVQPSLVFDP